MTDPLTEVLADLADEQADLDALVAGADLATATPAAGWDVRDCIGHLWFFDEAATTALTDRSGFDAILSRVIADPDGYMAASVAAGRGLGEAIVPRWRAGRAALLEALRRADPATKVPWYGPPMAPATFATARLMEYWAHGEDIADGLGATRPATARLRHICRLGVRTRAFSYAVRGRTPPATPVHVELAAPDGTTWRFGDEGAPDRVNGEALDFCRVVTQRRHVDDTRLQVVGAGAREWLEIAQAFAGTPSLVDPSRRRLRP